MRGTKLYVDARRLLRTCARPHLVTSDDIRVQKRYLGAVFKSAARNASGEQRDCRAIVDSLPRLIHRRAGNESVGECHRELRRKRPRRNGNLARDGSHASRGPRREISPALLRLGSPLYTIRHVEHHIWKAFQKALNY